MSNNSIQKLIESACEDSGDISFHPNYSGRGMFGRSCIGISASYPRCRELIAEIIKTQAFGIASDEVDEETRMSMHDEFCELVDHLLEHDRDSLGDDVILYWPGLPWIDSEEDAPEHEREEV